MTETKTNDLDDRAAAVDSINELRHALGPMRFQDVAQLAGDAYSVVWETGKRQRRDHDKALMAAIAAVAPLIEAGFLARHGNPAAPPTTIALDRLTPGMAVLLTHEHGENWVLIRWMELGDATGRTANMTWLDGEHAGEPVSRLLTEPAYRIRIW